MSEVWEIVIFWFAFSIISAWVLKRFYFSKNVVLAERLRVAAIVIEIATIGLFFFPWLPVSRGGFSGLELIIQVNDTGMMTLGGLILFSLGVFCIPKRSLFLKAGAVVHIIATAALFAVMIRMMPGTVQLALRDVAPIVAALLMLVNVVVVLLLWHQLQKGDKLNRP